MEGERVDGEKIERDVTLTDTKPPLVLDVSNPKSWYDSQETYGRMVCPKLLVRRLRIYGQLKTANHVYNTEWEKEVESKMNARFGPRKPDWVYEMWMPEAGKERVW